MNPMSIDNLPYIKISVKALKEAHNFCKKSFTEKALFVGTEEQANDFSARFENSIIESLFLDTLKVELPFNEGYISWFEEKRNEEINEAFEVLKNGDVRHYIYLRSNMLEGLEMSYVGYYDSSDCKFKLKKSLKDSKRGKKLVEEIYRKKVIDTWTRRFKIAMYYATHYREYIISKAETEDNQSAEVIRKPAKPSLNTITVKKLHSRVYILPESAPKERTYTKPDHEVSVRGFYRHYKNGKVSWVSPCTKYAGKGKSKKTVYEL